MKYLPIGLAPRLRQPYTHQPFVFLSRSVEASFSENLHRTFHHLLPKILGKAKKTSFSDLLKEVCSLNRLSGFFVVKKFLVPPSRSHLMSTWKARTVNE